MTAQTLRRVIRRIPYFIWMMRGYCILLTQVPARIWFIVTDRTAYMKAIPVKRDTLLPGSFLGSRKRTGAFWRSSLFIGDMSEEDILTKFLYEMDTDGENRKRLPL